MVYPNNKSELGGQGLSMYWDRMPEYKSLTVHHINQTQNSSSSDSPPKLSSPSEVGCRMPREMKPCPSSSNSGSTKYENYFTLIFSCEHINILIVVMVKLNDIASRNL